jgi:hypothetical protein
MAAGQGEPCLQGESSNMYQAPFGGTSEVRACAHDLETGKRPEIYEAGGRKKAGVVDVSPFQWKSARSNLSSLCV